ncbi:MAG TPA: phosphatase PAP2-related protein [Anaeromyxobacteraceae bacterium]|nr:phosphatase PAP2-related protein [Anaeromyxobacteraceae bacterium]
MGAIPAEATWREAWGRKAFRVHLAATVPALLAALAALAAFVKRVERRPGVVLPDPVLALFAPRDLTWLTFALIYVGLLAGVALLARRPRLLVAGAEAYVLMVLFRMAVMWVAPFDPPPGMIDLQDPLVERLGGTSQVLTRDLFFSGHTATLFLVSLAMPSRRSRVVLLLCAVAVGACVLLQHVHYTLDVLAAPFFAYGAWRLAGALWKNGPFRHG